MQEKIKLEKCWDRPKIKDVPSAWNPKKIAEDLCLAIILFGLFASSIFCATCLVMATI